ncbi:MAG: hypothetical protein M3065_20455 [Actinomycetota bacterium]|nr:hypothetical protein [Actinomycetota bacterium]
MFAGPFFRRLGGAITGGGLVGLALAGAIAGRASIAVLSGVVPGALLLAAGWWGAHQPTGISTILSSWRRSRARALSTWS